MSNTDRYLSVMQQVLELNTHSIPAWEIHLPPCQLLSYRRRGVKLILKRNNVNFRVNNQISTSLGLHSISNRMLIMLI